MKKLFIFIILFQLIGLISCVESGPIKGNTKGKTTVTVTSFEEESLVEVDGEVYSVWMYKSDGDYYKLVPIHREGEMFRVLSKYVKEYKPKNKIDENN